MKRTSSLLSPRLTLESRSASEVDEAGYILEDAGTDGQCGFGYGGGAISHMVTEECESERVYWRHNRQALT